MSLPLATEVVRPRDDGTEVSRRHSRPEFDPAEGPNADYGLQTRTSTGTEEAEDEPSNSYRAGE